MLKACRYKKHVINVGKCGNKYFERKLHLSLFCCLFVVLYQIVKHQDPFIILRLV